VIRESAKSRNRRSCCFGACVAGTAERPFLGLQRCHTEPTPILTRPWTWSAVALLNGEQGLGGSRPRGVDGQEDASEPCPSLLSAPHAADEW